MFIKRGLIILSRQTKNNSIYNLENNKPLIPKMNNKMNNNETKQINTQKPTQKPIQKQNQKQNQKTVQKYINKPVNKKRVNKKQPAKVLKNQKNISNNLQKKKTKNSIEKTQKNNAVKKKTINQVKKSNIQTKQKKAAAKKTIHKPDKNILDILPVRKSIYNKRGNVHLGYLLKDEKYINIFAVMPQDYPNISETNVCVQASTFDMFYRIYRKSIKFFAINMVVDTSSNQNYFKKKMEKTNKSTYKNILRDNIEAFQTIEVQSKQFYMEIFSDSYNELMELNSIVTNHLCSAGLLRPILSDEKKEVLKRLNNPFCYI